MARAAVMAPAILLLVGAAFALGARDYASPGPLPAASRRRLRKGRRRARSANLLAGEGVINNAMVFAAGTYLTGRGA